MKSLTKTYHIKASPKEIWNALTDPRRIKDWGADPANMDEKVGTKFKLWGGDIYGTNVKVQKEKLLVQEWYAGQWPEASKVKITLIKEKGGTKVRLVHENIPDSEFSDIKEGWNSAYFDPLKLLVEEKATPRNIHYHQGG